ncbi:protein of unknown function [Taphrina deformans PYCC 5710]|uniref:Fungal lipase-type domain-containing protein n=1 Tax=Taphrina deformans (strain PYCC 5710 / ATCC 11124 / CBS 356.35 / IMI 108563 / JCM 9778 / NBRC 8474) TaxID=1097556 RepID=R4X897_TAPDE|nr:protein of unknown function [Taphrina deformans PYCC 5710]|eukprot:CCG81753.1 protein of unknown function [Taphrina deformans PYCC 5710]
MNISSAIDTICAYFNTLSSFFATIQRLKNDYHARDIDYTSLILKLVRQPRVSPSKLGFEVDLHSVPDRYEKVLLAALVSLAVYHPDNGSDWTQQFTPLLHSRLQSSTADPWRRGKLRPVVVDLNEAHYMTSSKANVYMAVYKPLGCVVLSLPGTNSKSDWLSNLHSSTEDMTIDGSTTVKVHQGFKYIAQCLFTHQHIIKYLTDAMAAGFQKVLLCGHSQAGAVVSLLSILLDQTYSVQTDVVTFGSGACVQSAETRTSQCLGFVRCVQPDDSRPSLAAWQVDPVPLVDDALLAHDAGHGTMYPMGTLLVLLDAAPVVHCRQLIGGELSCLLHSVLMDFSAAPHSMRGYLRAIMSLANGAADDLLGSEYLAIVGESAILEENDCELARLQLMS